LLTYLPGPHDVTGLGPSRPLHKWPPVKSAPAYIGNIVEMLAPSSGFSGSGYWIMSHKFYHYRPLLPWERNLKQQRL